MANKRGRQTVRDMVLSLAVIGVVVGGIYLFIPRGDGTSDVRTVSYRVELDQARRSAPFAVAAPEGLGKGWRATSVTYSGANPEAAEWHLGFLDPQEQYAAVEQTNGAAAEFVDARSKQAEKDGTRTVDGVTWDRYEGTKYNALVREADGVTTMVTGTATHDRLAQLAAALVEERGGQ